MKVVILKGKGLHWISVLTKIFTGSRAYHIGFLSEKTGYFYDMVIFEGRRKTKWSTWDLSNKIVYEFPCKVNENYLTNMVATNTVSYGTIDFLLFFFRNLGITVKNMKGQICTEQVNFDLKKYNNVTPWPLEAAPPSPKEMLDWYSSK